MDPMLNRLVRAAVVATIVVGCSNVVLAVPDKYCPPLCTLPPDPAPPMPPINVPDPPFNPVAPQNPNNGNNGNKGTTSSLTVRKAGGDNTVTVTGTPKAGAECKAGNVSGTLVPQGSKFTCNFMPSTLPAGAACHAMNKIGTVTVVDGKRYCKIAP